MCWGLGLGAFEALRNLRVLGLRVSGGRGGDSGITVAGVGFMSLFRTGLRQFLKRVPCNLGFRFQPLSPKPYSSFTIHAKEYISPPRLGQRGNREFCVRLELYVQCEQS